MEAPLEVASRTGFAFGKFTLDPADERLLGPQGPVRIGHKALRVLECLLEQQGCLITKDQLFDSVWDGTIVSESALTSAIKELRRAIGDQSRQPRFIESVYGRGYRFIAAVEQVPLAPPSLAQSAKSEATGGRAGSSVAVLAFANLTGDPALAYVSDGIAEEIITTLSRFPGLKVPARTSSFAYKGREPDMRTIGRELGVATVLEGSVRKAGSRIRVAAQLIDSATGYHLWAQTFDRVLDDLLALQDEIAAEVGSALKAQIAPPPACAPDPKAYNLYLQARGLAGRATPSTLLKAVELHEQAIAADPRFARGRAGLAGTLLVASSLGVLPLERRSEARARADEAIALEPDLAAAHAIRAVLDATDGNWLQAESGFSTALKLRDNDPAVLEAMGMNLLAPCGQLRRAFELCTDAVEMAPAAANPRLSCAILALLSGDVSGAASHLETAALLGVAQERATYRLMQAELAHLEGRLGEAAERMADALAMAPPLASAGIAETTALVYAALAGEASCADASAAVGRFLAAADHQDAIWRYQGVAGRLLRWQVLLGSLDGAYRIADRLIESWCRCGHLATTSLVQIWRPDSAAFRDDARFPALSQRLGWIPFWERSGAPDGYLLARDHLIRT